jgi:threonine/homoserine/homoserine lactone efflux protein
VTLSVIAGTSFVLGFSGAIMPGPLLTVTIAETVRRGPWAGPQLVAGHALLEGAVVLLLFTGFGGEVGRPGLFAAFALIGAVMLLWMGYGMLRGLPTLRLDFQAGGRGGMHPLAAGVVVSLANPYFTLWWGTVGLGYLAVAHQAGLAGLATFYLFHILSDLVWYAFVSGTVSYGRRFLSDRLYRLLVGGCALFVIAFGTYFGYLGVQALLG